MIERTTKEIGLGVTKSKDTAKVDKNRQYLDLDGQHVNPVLDRYHRIVAERAKGSYIYDLNGDAYLDFGCGIAVTNIGHCHPKVVEAIQKQAAELIHTSVTTYNKRYIELAEKINEIAPGRLDSVFFSNSGAEAIEGAIKLARYVTGRPAVINFRGSFHGRTLMTMALSTSKLYYRDSYEPLPSSIYTSLFPYPHRSAHKNDPQACVQDALNYLEMLFHQFVSPKQVASMLVEPIQGEGGYIVPPPGFLKGLREVADKHGIILIFDEIQTGFGRTGKMFAAELEGVEPDILVVAKAIASGLPLSGFISRREITNKWKLGSHGTTFGGNPVSCAAALATIEVLESEKLPERAAKIGAEISSRLKKFASGKPYIGEVRGKGLMIGIEFDNAEGGPNKELTKQVVNKCLERKLIVLTCGSHSQVIRLIPPLNLSDSEAEKACDILEESITEAGNALNKK
jgi:4-aminobutyrate aminotransferase